MFLKFLVLPATFLSLKASVYGYHTSSFRRRVERERSKMPNITIFDTSMGTKFDIFSLISQKIRL